MNTNKLYAEHIAQEYALKRERKTVALKKLDRYARRPAVVFSYAFGTIAVLFQITGMNLLALSVTNADTTHAIISAALELAGLIGMVINCPLYNRLTGHCRSKYRDDVVELSRQIIEDTF